MPHLDAEPPVTTGIVTTDVVAGAGFPSSTRRSLAKSEARGVTAELDTAWPSQNARVTMFGYKVGPPS